MTTVIQPAAVANRAGQILDARQADPEFGRLWEGCAEYSSEWDDFYVGWAGTCRRRESGWTRGDGRWSSGR